MGSVEKSIAAQAKIRKIAEEQHNVLKGFDSWEKSIKRRDKELRHCDNNSSDKSEFSSYTFDQSHTSVIDKKIKEDEIPPVAKIKGRNSSLYITPSTITATQLRAVSKVDVEPNVQSEISANSKQELANSARLRGNKFFADEKFDEAIKSYTKSIMLDSNSCIVYSNRAMAYLKIKDWKNAEEDSSYALKQDPLHAKSYQRRAMARVAQGKLRAGLKDLNLADNCSERPPHKELLREKKKVQTLLLEAIRRAPKRDLNIIEISEPNSSFAVDSKISTDLNEKKTEDDSKNNLQRCHQSKARKMLSNLSSTPDNNIESTNKIEKQAWKAPKTWHQFETKWKSLVSRKQRVKYLQFITPNQLSSYYENGIENVDILLDLLLCSAETKEEKLSFFNTILNLPSVGLMGMMVSEQDRISFLQELKEALSNETVDRKCLKMLSKLGF